MDRVRRISTELLTRYPDKFAPDFEQNKKLINELATVRSKVLRNTIAGYITSYLRKNSTRKESEATSAEVDSSEQQNKDIDEERAA
jgi:small subunit ribosomal protein S17e